jgi:pimeloyl-ACP methyl ester carboxylesterase
VPILVVLHDRGSTKEAVGQSFWKAIADELGLALIAPSGRVPTGDDPAQGLAWLDGPQAYQQGAWKYEKTIQTALDAFGKEHKIDRERVYIAGEGEGGTVAFNAAVGAPGQYKGVISIDGPVLLSLAQPKAANAAKLGLRGWVYLGGTVPGAHAEADIPALAASMGKALQSAGLAKVMVASYKPSAEQPDQRKQLALSGLRDFLASAAPVEAGAQK